MSDNEIERRVKKVRRYLSIGLRSIASWHKVVPLIQQTDEQLEWIEGSISQSPSAISAITSEELLDYLDKAEKAIAVLETIPAPSVELGPTLNTSGSASYSAYGVFLGRVFDNFRSQPEVVEWVRQTLLAGENLMTIQSRSEIVRKRLTALNPELGALHTRGVEATLTAQADVQTPIEPGAVLDRLLEQFKGALIARCKSGKGTDYARISENLSANSELTRIVVSDGQLTYQALHEELIEVRKSKKPATGQQMIRLLRQLEEHIKVITDALDPDKVGVVFSNE